MPKTHNNLIERIASIDNLRNALDKTSRGKRNTFAWLEFKEYSGANLALLREELMDGVWEQGPCRNFPVFEPKERLISALAFKDRIAQHALINVVGPILDNALLPYTFGCREGKGTHAGVRHIQSRLRQTGHTHFLKTDYRKFFPSIVRKVLHGRLDRHIYCRQTRRIMRSMIPEEGVGLGIGYLTSQICANTYGDMVDRFIHFTLGARHWGRYMDDIVILSSNPYELRHWFEDIEAFSKEEMGMDISHWHISPVNRGIDYLGYRIWPRHKLLRKDSVTRAKRKIRHYIHKGDEDALAHFIPSWLGHAKFADSCNLLNHLEDSYGIKIRNKYTRRPEQPSIIQPIGICQVH
jgi:retron-type reverse transcriptase